MANNQLYLNETLKEPKSKKLFHGLELMYDDESKEVIIGCFTDINDEMQQFMRYTIRVICYGERQDYEDETIKCIFTEILGRYENFNDNGKIGYLGELTMHVFFRKLNNDNQYVFFAPFFNPTDRNFKKGFDNQYFSKILSDIVWIETKSSKSCDTKELLKKADDDIREKINDAEEFNRILRIAGNELILSLEDKHSYRKQISSLIDKYKSDIEKYKSDVNDGIDRNRYSKICNVVLNAVTFSDEPPEQSQNKDELKITKEFSKKKKSEYNNLTVIAIDNTVEEKMVQFLKNESE